MQASVGPGGGRILECHNVAKKGENKTHTKSIPQISGVPIAWTTDGKCTGLSAVIKGLMNYLAHASKENVAWQGAALWL